MVAVEIGEIVVDFPFEPYSIQIEYMKKVYQCLELGRNGVLESPTGTGKTLCLICTTLAWIEHRKQESINTSVEPSTSSVVVLPAFSPFMNAVPRLVYSSRTHSQLSQVVKELKKTIYYDRIQMSQLGSRDVMCVDEEVKKAPSLSIKNHMCRSKVKKRTCRAYNNLEKLSDAETTSLSFSMDIEDLVKRGQGGRFCPYYATRQVPDPDLILVPYNYIIDPRTRRSNNLDLKGAILVIDEAHNIQNQCEESVSCSMSSMTLASAIREAKTMLAQILDDAEKLREQMDETDKAFGSTAGDQDAEKIEVDTSQLTHLVELLLDLDSIITAVSEGKLVEGICPRKVRQACQKDGIEFPGVFMMNVLQKANINFAMRQSICSLIDSVGTYSTKSSLGVNLTTGALEKFSSFISTVYPADKKLDDISDKFSAFLTRKDEGWELNYWCWDASLGMNLVLANQLHSLILTSGTLSPIDKFISSIKINTAVTLENEHVVEKGQVWFGIMGKTPTGRDMYCTYNTRKEPSFVKGIADTIAEMASVIPEGFVVFFSSYSQRRFLMEQWQERGLLSRIEHIKPVIIENQRKEMFAQNIQEYRRAVYDESRNGAIFFAVCRGKASEGYDFSDRECRGVMVIGIPLPPIFDPRVCLKKEYLNELKKKTHSTGISGDDWYQLEAMRTVNQAIGRAIRHSNDYGAIILADIRYFRWLNGPQSPFPIWIKENIRKPNNFNEFGSELRKFFQTHRRNRMLYGGGERTKSRDSSSSIAVPLRSLSSGAAGPSSHRHRNAFLDDSCFPDSSQDLYRVSSSQPAGKRSRDSDHENVQDKRNCLQALVIEQTSFPAGGTTRARNDYLADCENSTLISATNSRNPKPIIAGGNDADDIQTPMPSGRLPQAASTPMPFATAVTPRPAKKKIRLKKNVCIDESNENDRSKRQNEGIAGRDGEKEQSSASSTAKKVLQQNDESKKTSGRDGSDSSANSDNLTPINQLSLKTAQVPLKTVMFPSDEGPWSLPKLQVELSKLDGSIRKRFKRAISDYNSDGGGDYQTLIAQFRNLFLPQHWLLLSKLTPLIKNEDMIKFQRDVREARKLISGSRG